MAYGLLYDYLMGQTANAYEYFGAHFEKEGVVFRLYAPAASEVSVVGDWNGWNPGANPMQKVDECGAFECFIPNLREYQAYKFHFKNAESEWVEKADPFAFFSEQKPNTASKLFDYRGFPWADGRFLARRGRNLNRPMSIYEVHLASWRGRIDGRYPSYEEVADQLIPYVKEMGFTHVELMPITQHPFDGSWGYQATGFYSADSRYGNPKQLMSFVNRMHEAGIGVILDFAPVHFAGDAFGLRRYDGTCLYEYSGEHEISSWGSPCFDLGKDPVRSFLVSAMNYFLNEFHFDGIRMDAVSNMLFYEGNRNKGVNEGAVEFLKRANGKLHYLHPGVMMIAEDSTDFQGVTTPVEKGGIGFDYKWDLGWMNDTLKYYSKDPIYKKYEHNKLTFSMMYFYSERFILPLSHDEVVHMKGTLLHKMWGDYYEQFALLRNLYAYQFAHPGKKLLFMGDEFADTDEWNEAKSLPWNLLSYPAHDSVKRMLRDLNLIYRAHPAFYAEEYEGDGFEWTMVDNADQSVFAFLRHGRGETVLCLFNMTPNFYESYDVGVMKPGYYEEFFNSDKDVYGGANQYNGLSLKAAPGGPEGRPYHISVKLAAFGAMFFKKTVPPHHTKG